MCQSKVSLLVHQRFVSLGYVIFTNATTTKKGQLYLGDLSNEMIWVRYNTHTYTRSHKQGQESYEYQCKKQRTARECETNSKPK